MAEAARAPDLIDVRPAFTQGDADAFNDRFAGVDAATMLRIVLRERLAGEVVAVSSFGAESAVLLDLVAAADPATPVLMVDTLKLFPETLRYAETLRARLGLTNVIVAKPDPAALAARDGTGLRWSYDPDGCCAIRKTAPLEAGLAPYDAWISGRKAFQASTRANLPRFEIKDGRLKINPIADWTKADLDAHFAARGLPRHPLEAQGYPSIGCAPCTSKVKPGEDPRAGRWRGWDKTECGIHVDDDATDKANDPAF